MNDELLSKINEFIQYAQNVVNANNKANGYPNNEIIKAEFKSQWCKLVKVSPTESKTYAFIAIKNGSNHNLGKFEVGDIHRPINPNTPAKHKKGSVFHPEFNNCANPYGINYA